MIIKSMKCRGRENHFEIRGGERIKFGRIIFTVKECVNDKVKFYGTVEKPVFDHTRRETYSSELGSNTFDGEFEHEEGFKIKT